MKVIPTNNDDALQTAQLLAVAAVAHMLLLLGSRQKKRIRREVARFARKRSRRSTNEIYSMLGPYYFRRAYRMSFEAFNSLVAKLTPFMHPRQVKYARINGSISNSVRVAAAIRYLAGGASYDIATTFGIAVSEVFESLWEVIDAINKHPDFDITYPESHAKQEQIAAGFKKKSTAGFATCAGAIDGILIWTNKPQLKCCVDSRCDEGMFILAVHTFSTAFLTLVTCSISHLYR
jgi:hypothetical protein